MSDLRRVCSKCGDGYASDVIFCPQDGTPLGGSRTEVADDPYAGLLVQGQFRIEQLIGKQLALLEVPGVERRDRPAVASAQERLPRFKRSLFEERKQPVHRTLGGKFPPARGRRRP